MSQNSRLFATFGIFSSHKGATCFSKVERLVLQFTDEVNANVKHHARRWKP